MGLLTAALNSTIESSARMAIYLFHYTARETLT